MGAVGQRHNPPALDSSACRRDSALILAFQARRISPGLPDHGSFPAAAKSVQALHTLQGMGRSGIVQSLRVVLELPPQSPPLSPAGWIAVSRLTKRFQSDPRAEEVLSLPTLTGNV